MIYARMDAPASQRANEEPGQVRIVEIASEVRRLRDKLRPKVKLAILSNSSTAHLRHIQEALALFDAPVMKLDAGDPQNFVEINRPAAGVRLERIVEGLKNNRGLIIQSVLIDGKVNNLWGKANEAWISAYGFILETNGIPINTARRLWAAGHELFLEG